MQMEYPGRPAVYGLEGRCPVNFANTHAHTSDTAVDQRRPGETAGGSTSMTAAELSAMLPAMLPRLWIFALRLAGDRHDAEDLVQCACVRALERAHQLQPETAPLSWMFSIVQSTWLNELRARSVRRRAGMDWDDELLETVADPAASTFEQQALDAQIVRAVQQLPEAQRVVMLLVGVEGFTYREAANVLDVPLGTVMSRLSRARQAIGALFGEQGAPRATRAANAEDQGA